MAGQYRTLRLAASLALLSGLCLSRPGSAQEPSEYPSSKQGGNYMYNFYFPPAPSSTPWAPDWSPDGKWLAVGMSGSIWKGDPQSGRARGLTQKQKDHPP